MKRENQVKIKCPKCGNEIETTSVSAVSISAEARAQRDEVLNKKLNICICEKCQTNIEIGTTMLYHDVENAFMVYYVPSLAIDVVREELNNIKDNLQQSTENLGYNFLRIVNSYDALIEKIIIAESGLDDRIVELVKIILYGQMQGKKVNAVYYDSTKEDKMAFLVLEEGNPHLVAISADSYKVIEEKVADQFTDSLDWLIVDSNYAMEFVDKIS